MAKMKVPPRGKRLGRPPADRAGKPASASEQRAAAKALTNAIPDVMKTTSLSRAQVKKVVDVVIKVFPEVLRHVSVGGLLGHVEADVCGGNACTPHYRRDDPACTTQCEGESACGAQACPHEACASHHCGGQECSRNACGAQSCTANSCVDEACTQLQCGEESGCDPHECEDYSCEQTAKPCDEDQSPPTTETPGGQMRAMARTQLWAELVAELAKAGPAAGDRARALQLEVVGK